MAKLIHRKLDFLMTLTNTRNSVLASVTNFDASYIARMRRGERGLPKHQPFVDPAAIYFAPLITQPWQLQAAADTITPGVRWPADPGMGASLIADWLNSDQVFEETVLPVDTLASTAKGKAFFYGNAGKRRVVLLFLKELFTLKKLPELLLYSDENTDWMFEDAAFVRQWTGLLIRYLSSGGHITIIHNIKRNFHEMLSALQGWMPLYLYGKIDSYYYPRLRDDVAHHTLFVARGHSAVVAHSIGEDTEHMVNLLISHVEATKALEKEFHNYLALCQPLMQVYHAANAKKLLPDIQQMALTASPLITMGCTPSFFTMPAEVAAQQNTDFAAQCAQAQNHLQTQLAKRVPVTELLCLPDMDTVCQGAVALPLSDLWGAAQETYTPAAFAAHLHSILHYLTTYDTYQVVLTDHIPDKMLLLCRQEHNVFVLPAAPPSTVFSITQPDLLTSIWEYLNHFIGRPDKAAVIDALQDYLQLLTSNPQ